MTNDYERVIANAREREGGLPHLRPDGAAKLRGLLAPLGVPSPF
jgi:hypothetical protein